MRGFKKFLRFVPKIGPKRRSSKARRSSGLPTASLLPELEALLLPELEASLLPQDAFSFEGYVESASSFSSTGTEPEAFATEPNAPDPEPATSSAASPEGMEPTSAASPEGMVGLTLKPASSSARPEVEPAFADPERQPIELDSSATDPDGQIKPDADPALSKPEEGPPGLAHVHSLPLPPPLSVTVLLGFLVVSLISILLCN
jgi:hypothetical protein